MKKLQLTTKQIMAAIELLKGIKQFSESGYGTIKNVQTLGSLEQDKTLFIKYEKYYTEAGEQKYEFKIAEINADGDIDYVDERLKDIFQKSQFLSVCFEVDLDNENSFEKID